MDDFRETIARLASAAAAGARDHDAETAGDGAACDSLLVRALEHLFGLGCEAATVYNGVLGTEELVAYDTPPAVLNAFLNFRGVRRGFAIIGAERYALFVDSPPDGVLVLGTKTERPDAAVDLRTRTRQLIRLCLSAGEDGTVVYRDTTGGVLDPEEVVALVVGWVSGSR